MFPERKQQVCILWPFVMAMSLLFVLLTSFSFQAETSMNPGLKAERLASFAKYIEWPNDDHSQPFIIVVFGDQHFCTYLKYAFQNRKIKDRTVEIKGISQSTSLSHCNILYIGQEVPVASLEEIVHFTQGKPILTVSDQEGLVHKGVIISFLNAGEKFEYNLQASQKARLNVSSRLLEVAKVIH
jgi:hypothetical protein